MGASFPVEGRGRLLRESVAGWKEEPPETLLPKVEQAAGANVSLIMTRRGTQDENEPAATALAHWGGGGLALLFLAVAALRAAALGVAALGAGFSISSAGGVACSLAASSFSLGSAGVSAAGTGGGVGLIPSGGMYPKGKAWGSRSSRG